MTAYIKISDIKYLNEKNITKRSVERTNSKDQWRNRNGEDDTVLRNPDGRWSVRRSSRSLPTIAKARSKMNGFNRGSISETWEKVIEKSK